MWVEVETILACGGRTLPGGLERLSWDAGWIWSHEYLYICKNEHVCCILKTHTPYYMYVCYNKKRENNDFPKHWQPQPLSS